MIGEPAIPVAGVAVAVPRPLAKGSGPELVKHEARLVVQVTEADGVAVEQHRPGGPRPCLILLVDRQPVADAGLQKLVRSVDLVDLRDDDREQDVARPRAERIQARCMSTSSE